MEPKQKIFIVDDSEINRAQLREILGDTYEDLEGESGMGAVDILRRHTAIALVLLDLSMPEMDGFDVLRAVRSTPVEGCPEVKLLGKHRLGVRRHPRPRSHPSGRCADVPLQGRPEALNQKKIRSLRRFLKFRSEGLRIFCVSAERWHCSRLSPPPARPARIPADGSGGRRSR